MAKIVSLSVHKNTLAKRKRDAAYAGMVRFAKQQRGEGLAGYVSVAFDENGRWNAAIHDPDAVVGLNALPDWIRGAVHRQIAELDTEE